jgi:hypothetical protein
MRACGIEKTAVGKKIGEHVQNVAGGKDVHRQEVIPMLRLLHALLTGEMMGSEIVNLVGLAHPDGIRSLVYLLQINCEYSLEERQNFGVG